MEQSATELFSEDGISMSSVRSDTTEERTDELLSHFDTRQGGDDLVRARVRPRTLLSLHHEIVENAIKAVRSPGVVSDVGADSLGIAAAEEEGVEEGEGRGTGNFVLLLVEIEAVFVEGSVEGARAGTWRGGVVVCFVVGVVGGIASVFGLIIRREGVAQVSASPGMSSRVSGMAER